MAQGEGHTVRDDEPDQRQGAGDRARRGGLWLVGRPWILIGVVGLLALGVWIKGTRTEPHEVKAVFTEAVSVYPGLDVRVDGLDAGKVKSVKNEDGQAVITLGIGDNQVWPLHQGTKVSLRFGSTIGNGTRILQVDPGPKSAPVIPDGGIIANKNTVEAVEFDQVFNTFNSKTREALKGTLGSTGFTFKERSGAISSGVKTSGAGLESLANLTGDLSADEPALRAFVANTFRVTSTLGAKRTQISDLVNVASQTFATFAANTNGIESSLEKFPNAQRQTRTTLARLDTSVGHLNSLMRDLRPGATQLGLLSQDLRPALADLRTTIPDAVSTFRTARQTAPDITKLLKRAEPFSDKATPVLAGVAPIVGCFRPYAPEFASFLTEWTSFTQPVDKFGHLGRLFGNAGATSVTSLPVSAGDFVKASGQDYALIRPPGFNAGQPQFLPECGVTAAGLDPSKDPEAPK